MNIAILILETASAAFFIWGGLLSLMCIFQARDAAFPNRELRLADQRT
jgi:hypothetical protein